MPVESEETAARNLIHAIALGQLRHADIICRALISTYPESPGYYVTLGDIALRLLRPDVAIESYGTALRLSPGLFAARIGLATAKKNLERLAASPKDASLYLLIKAWGFGFWSDTDHVLASLLFAELTGRIPIVAWGQNSLFRGSTDSNAWNNFFEPVSRARLDDLHTPGLTFFPSKWSAENIDANNHGKWHVGRGQVSLLYFFNRLESVVVADYYDTVADLVPWIHSGSSYFSKPIIEIYRALSKKYLIPLPHIGREVDNFWNKHMAGQRWLAVHIRGSDKIVEVSDLADVNESYFPLIDERILQFPDVRIFLLTDSVDITRRMQVRYGDKVIFTASFRSEDDVGVHYSNRPGDVIGRQVLVDSLLGSRCDYFIGNGSSNVSISIEYLRDWPEGTFQLLGQDRRGIRYSLVLDQERKSTN